MYIHGYKIAPIWKRFFAALVDIMIQTATLYGVSYFYAFINDSVKTDIPSTELEFVMVGLISLALGGIFYPIFSGNLGHRVLGIKVIDADTGNDFNKAHEGAIRELLKGFLTYLIIPIIWLLWDKQTQNVYDKLSKTLVVETDSRR